MENTAQIREMYHLNVSHQQRKGDMELGSMGRIATEAAVEGVGRSPAPIEMQALPVRQAPLLGKIIWKRDQQRKKKWT